MRIKKIEFGVAELRRRIDSHDVSLKKDREDISMLQDIAKSNKEILEAVHSVAEYAKKTYEVFEPLARFGVRLAKYSAIFVAAWHAAKWAWAKFMVLT